MPDFDRADQNALHNCRSSPELLNSSVLLKMVENAVICVSSLTSKVQDELMRKHLFKNPSKTGT